MKARSGVRFARGRRLVRRVDWLLALRGLGLLLRRCARPIRHAPDRLLHRVRRWRALRRLHAHGVPRRVLFVCHGNICRSPYAQISFERHLPPRVRDRIQVRSAGFVGGDRACPREALIAAAQRGVDLSGHRAKLLNFGDAPADLIFVMSCDQRRAVRRRLAGRADVLLLGDLDPRPIDTRSVSDPVDRPQEAFEAVYARIDRCLGEVVRAVMRNPAVTSLKKPYSEVVNSEGLPAISERTHASR